MKRVPALKLAAWAYFAVAGLLLLAAVGGPLIGRTLTTGQVASLAILVSASIGLGMWSRRIQLGRAKLRQSFFLLSFMGASVLGVTLGSLFHALLLAVPFMFVAVAWRDAHSVQKGEQHGG